MNTVEVRNDRAPADDEIAAAVLAVYSLRRRAAQPSNHVSGWRRAARAEAIGQASADWGRKGRIR